ncbi:hypothetical protein ACIQCQ_40575 [Streptomyces sp. NPDC088394]|uniref:hypothetical protein n=1 Tax=Streptomyces sp. NPDC088394 TaxID=3365860 RepID=UPI0037F53F26
MPNARFGLARNCFSSVLRRGNMDASTGKGAGPLTAVQNTGIHMHTTRKILVGMGAAALLATGGMNASAADGAPGANPAQDGHASASADATVAALGSPPETTASQEAIGVKGMCPGDRWARVAEADKNNMNLKKNYYNASSTLVTLSAGTIMSYYGNDRNSYGNLWHHVQYSNRENDWCGWVSDNWVKVYVPG